MKVTDRILLIETEAVRQRIDTPQVRAICDGVDGLPPAPYVYRALTEAAADPRCNIIQLAAIIETDPVISAAVLQLVNSAFFGRMRRMVSIRQAVGYIGLDLLRALVLSAHLARQTLAVPSRGLSVEMFQRHSLRTARLTKRFLTNPVDSDLAFTASLLVDIGQLVLSIRRPTLYAEVLEQARQTAQPIHVIEKTILGTTHAEVGGFILAAWGLPPEVIECVALSHDSARMVTDTLVVRAALHAADALLGIAQCGDPETSLDLELLAVAGVEHRLPSWRRFVAEEVRLAS